MQLLPGVNRIVSMDPIIVRPGESGRLTVLLPYSPERVAKIKTVPGRAWRASEKLWSVPEGAAAQLRTLFADDHIEFANDAKSSAPLTDMERARAALRSRHMSPRTEESYLGWIRRYLEDRRDPSEPAEAAISRFLSRLATEGHVASSTQNQALHALLFYHQEALGQKVERVLDVVRAKQPERLPVVLSRDEVLAVLHQMSGTPRLMAMILYGAGPQAQLKDAPIWRHCMRRIALARKPSNRVQLSEGGFQSGFHRLQKTSARCITSTQI